ncbi:STAS domain-containing protein [Flavobacteriales bacterium]|nr:STAS domain-containing protein [Flavobacteriales bacterium]
MNFVVEKKEKHSLITSKVEKLNNIVAPELKSEVVMLDKNGEASMIIDLSETRYCDSSGLSALLVANRLTKAAGGTLVIVGLQSSVEKLIQISQLHTVLNITPTVNEAVDLLSVNQVENDMNDED